MGGRRAEIVCADPGAQLVAVADIDRTRAAQVASRWGTEGCRVTTQWETVTADDSVDAVIVSTYNDALAPVAMAALQAGKDVFCEKPMGRNVSEARAMVNAARETGHLLQIGFNHRHHPAIRRAHTLLNEGAIGELMYVRALYGHGGRPGYEREWRFTPDIAGGGQILDQGVHLLDLAHWFMGQFSQVFARLGTFFWPVEPLEDNAFVILWREDGKTAQLHTSVTQWRNRFEFETFGQEGYLSIQGLGESYGVERLTLGRRRPQSGPPEETEWTFPGEDISWQAEWDEFVRAIKTGIRPLCDAESALHSMELADAVYRSARAGQTVSIQRGAAFA